MDSFFLGFWSWVVEATQTSPRVASAPAAFETDECNQIHPAAMDHYVIAIEPGKSAQVQFECLGGEELEVFVFSSFLRLIAADQSLGQTCRLTWTADRTGYAIVTVRNRGSAANRYTLKATGRLVQRSDELDLAEASEACQLLKQWENDLVASPHACCCGN